MLRMYIGHYLLLIVIGTSSRKHVVFTYLKIQLVAIYLIQSHLNGKDLGLSFVTVEQIGVTKEGGRYAKVSERWGKRIVKISKNCCPLNLNGSFMFVIHHHHHHLLLLLLLLLLLPFNC